MDTAKSEFSGFDESKSLHRTHLAVGKTHVQCFKTFPREGQNTANISQKHWEKTSEKVWHRNGSDESLNRCVPVTPHTISLSPCFCQVARYIEKWCMKREVCFLESLAILRGCVLVCMSPPLEGLFSHSDLQKLSVIIQAEISPLLQSNPNPSLFDRTFH